jgi:segregation and condensation protein B
MSLKAKIEAIIYAAETPITLDQIVQLVKDSSDGGDANELRTQVRAAIEELTAEYAAEGRGIEIRQIAGGYRMSTKPEQHDVVRAFAKSLKPPIRLSLPALETLAVIAYKQPVTVPEISEIRGVDSSGVIATLLDRKLITTSGRRDVIGRPILYKTTKEFLLRFGLKDVNELPSMEEFEKLVAESFQSDLLPAEEQQPDRQPEAPAVEAEKSA